MGHPVQRTSFCYHNVDCSHFFDWLGPSCPPRHLWFLSCRNKSFIGPFALTWSIAYKALSELSMFSCSICLWSIISVQPFMINRYNRVYDQLVQLYKWWWSTSLAINDQWAQPVLWSAGYDQSFKAYWTINSAGYRISISSAVYDQSVYMFGINLFIQRFSIKIALLFYFALKSFFLQNFRVSHNKV